MPAPDNVSPPTPLPATAATEADPLVTPDFREIHRLDMRLTYADCDPAGIIYFAAWFPWMERVQSEWMFLHDLRQDTLLERFGFKTITRATECEYLAQASLFDHVRISLGFAKLGNTSLRYELRMVRQSDRVMVARGSVSLVILDGDNQPIPVPEPLRGLVQAALPAA